jgi:hypothetical protein
MYPLASKNSIDETSRPLSRRSAITPLRFASLAILVWVALVAFFPPSVSAQSGVEQSGATQSGVAASASSTPHSIAVVSQGSNQVVEVTSQQGVSEDAVWLPNCSIESEIYELSTRHLSDRFCSINEETPNLEVYRWGNCRWNTSNLGQALHGDDKLTIVYVHGNFMERENARERVRIIDAYLKRQAKESYRLLQFSWPSEKQRPILRDAADNAKVAEMESLYLAWILKQLQSQSRVSILGFSYGARTVTGALHLDAGGSIPGLSFMPPGTPRPTPYRLGLIAPAVDKKWLTSSGRYSSALNQVDGFVNLYNSRDPVLRRFRFIDNVTRPIAGGLNGFDGLYDPRSVSPLAGGDADNVRQFDCGSIIGTTHSEKSYLGKCPYFRVLLDNLLWNPSANEPACSSCIEK